MKRRTASNWVTCSSVGGGWRRGSARGATGNSRLSAHVERDAAGDEDLDARTGAKQPTQRRGSLMTCSKLSSTRSVCFSARWRRNNSIAVLAPISWSPRTAATAVRHLCGIVNRGQLGEPDSIRKIGEESLRHLHRESGLSRAPGTGQRGQAAPHPEGAMPAQRPSLARGQGSQLVVLADCWATFLRRAAPGRAGGSQVDKLVDPARLLQILEPVLTQVAKLRTGWEHLPNQLTQGRRHEDLTTVTSRQQPSQPVQDGGAIVTRSIRIDRSRVERHAHAHGLW